MPISLILFIYQPDHVNLERVLLWTTFSYWSCFLLLSGECNSNLLLKSLVGMNSGKIIYLTNLIVTSKLHARAMMSRFLNLSTILPSDIRNATFMITMDVNALNTNYIYVWYLLWLSIYGFFLKPNINDLSGLMNTKQSYLA